VSGQGVAPISWADTASSVAALVRSLREDNGERRRRG
jgi:hypothetical protein